MYEYNRDDLQGLIDFIGGKTRRSGREIRFEFCPVCGSSKDDRYTSSINEESGLFNCKRGSCPNPNLNFITLAREVGYTIPRNGDYKLYKYPQPKERDTRQEAIDYLKGRGISEEVTRRYYITVNRSDPTQLCFPFYDENNVLQCIKFRRIGEKPENAEGWSKEYFHRPKGLQDDERTKPILFGMSQCNSALDRRLIITEGQIDSLSVAEAGYHNCVSVPNGKNGFTWLQYCKDWIEKNFHVLIVFGDNEHGEMSLLDKLMQEISIEVKAVRLPDYMGCKDANEILQGYGAEAIRKCIESAEAPPLKGILHMCDVHETTNDIIHCRTRFKALDRCIRGIQTGRLYIVSGKRGEGKSTFLSQIGADLLQLNDDVKLLVYSGELQNSNFKSWIFRQCSGNEDIEIIHDEEFGDDYKVKDYRVKELEHRYHDRLLIISDVTNADRSVDLLDMCQEAVKRYKVNFIVIDNLMSLIARVEYKDQYAAQSQMTARLAAMAHGLNVGIFLVAHPKKNIGGDMMDNISGSNDISNLADFGMFFGRDYTDSERDCYLEVVKNRVNGNLLEAKRNAKLEVIDGGDEISLRYNKVTMQLSDIHEKALETLQKKVKKPQADELPPIDDILSQFLEV